MTDLPAAAITAATKAVDEMDLPGGIRFDAHACWRIAQAVLEAAAPHLTAAERSARLAEQDAVHDDLAYLLRVLGLGDHARPQSPHEVMLDAINEVGKLRTRLQAREDELTMQGRMIIAARAEEREAERARLREPVTTITGWFEHLPQRHVPPRAAEALARLRNLTAPGEAEDAP